MKFFLVLIVLSFSTAFAQAQNSWQIALNGRIMISSHEPDESVNIKPLRSSDWKKNGYLTVLFREAQPSNWHHSLRFTDENGVELLVRDSVLSAKLAVSMLRKLFTGRRQLKIYIVISPPNPMMAAPSRMIHLGTLKLP